jgi:hypothetical protein
LSGSPFKPLVLPGVSDSSLARVTLGKGITVLPDKVFYGCDKLKTITIPEGVTAIGRAAFNGCSALESVSFPSTIAKISLAAFQNCPALVTVSIPDSVTAIEFNVKDGEYNYQHESSFSGCSKLTLASQAALKKRGYTDSF